MEGQGASGQINEILCTQKSPCLKQPKGKHCLPEHASCYLWNTHSFSQPYVPPFSPSFFPSFLPSPSVSPSVSCPPSPSPPPRLHPPSVEDHSILCGEPRALQRVFGAGSSLSPSRAPPHQPFSATTWCSHNGPRLSPSLPSSTHPSSSRIFREQSPSPTTASSNPDSFPARQNSISERNTQMPPPPLNHLDHLSQLNHVNQRGCLSTKALPLPLTILHLAHLDHCVKGIVQSMTAKLPNIVST